MSRLRALLCRVLGHQWSVRTDQYPRSWTRIAECRRCGLIESTRGLTTEADRAFVFRRLVSSWSRLSDRLAAPAIERASRRGTAATEAPAPEDIPEGSTPLPGRHFGSEIGGVVLYPFVRGPGWYGYVSSTGAPAPTAASSTSTPTPSPDSRRSRAASSR